MLKNMLTKSTQFIHYLLTKRSELQELESKDLLLAKLVINIHRKRSHSASVFVPLFSIQQIHAIDRDNAIQATEQRTLILKAVQTELRQKRELSKEELAKYLPSVSGIKVVKSSNNKYIAYEGNGRLVALQTVFTTNDNISLEVEEYYFKKPKRIIKAMLRIRDLNGFSDLWATDFEI